MHSFPGVRRRLGSWYVLLPAVVLIGIFVAIFIVEDTPLKQEFQRGARIVRNYNYPWSQPHILWETGPPESQMLDSAKLDGLRDALAGQGTESLLVVRRNRLVYEWYSKPWDINEKNSTASLVTALAGGMSLWAALSEGRIALDDPAWAYIPAWKDDALKSQITVRHLAAHSSGIEHAAENGKTVSELSGWKQAYWLRSLNPIATAIFDAPVVFPPGERYEFSAPGLSALAYAITAASKGSLQPDIFTILKERIMGPIGVPESDWQISYGEVYSIDGLNVYEIRGGGRYTSRATARVGQLVLNRGEWQGEQLLDSAALDEMLSTSNRQNTKLRDGEPLPVAGGWHANFNGVWPSLPEDAIVASGAGHQLLLIVPSLELVVVRTGDTLTGASDGAGFWGEAERSLFNPLMGAFMEP